MAWDFETDPEFQRELDWMDDFVREEIEPLDFIIGHPNDFTDPNREKLIPPLQAEVKKRGLWACHLGPDLGGQGYGQLKLGLMNEILGRAKCAPVAFGCQAPDSGNAEILAHYGTQAQKDQYLQPLLDNEICSCYSMTEPQGGADPKVFTCSAELIGDELGHQRREVVLVKRPLRLLPDRHGGDRPGGAALPAHVHVHRARRHAGGGDRAPRGSRLRKQGRPRLHPLQRRARAQGPPARQDRSRLHRRPDPARRRAASTMPCAPSARSGAPST